MLNLKTILIFTFYAISGLLFLWLFYRKSGLKRISCMSAILFVLVGREYWEIPVFISAFLGIQNLSDTLQPLTALFLAFILFTTTKVEITSKVAFWIVLGLIINLTLLYPLIYTDIYKGQVFARNLFAYVCRSLGLTCLGSALFAGSSLVRS